MATSAARSPGTSTGNVNGVYFALGTTYANDLSVATGGRLTATAARTGAWVQNFQQLVAGTYQVAHLADGRRSSLRHRPGS